LFVLMGASICCAAAEAGTQFTVVDLSALKKQYLIFSPIVAARFDKMEEALAFWSGLLERVVYVNMVLPPATPDGACLLRCSVSAGHTPEQMDNICQAFTDAKDCE
jgi:7-keto-8-aminopelargonate synthetase-like enzyme